MAFYGIAMTCPDCNQRLLIDQVGVGSDWTLAINYHCPKCNSSGGHAEDLIGMVHAAQKEDAALLA